jgi:hypothetical protein
MNTCSALQKVWLWTQSPSVIYYYFHTMRYLVLVFLFLYILGTLAIGSKPIQLLRPSADHTQLELVDESLNLLLSVQEPMAILGVIGPYHSGRKCFDDLNNREIIFIECFC